MSRKVTFAFTLLLLLSLCPFLSAHSEELRPLSRSELLKGGFNEWTWLESSCQECELAVVILEPEIQTEKVLRFAQALNTYKFEILYLYRDEVSEEEYNLLAHMAMGILGRESLFFESLRYQVKEAVPGGVSFLKYVMYWLLWEDSVSPNSRGPTQIKRVPERIMKNFGLTTDLLYVPEHAAMATIAFLIESLGELKRRVKKNDLDHIRPENYVDYLPYIYFGGTRALVNKTATPETNLYVQEMKLYMSWVQLFVRPVEIEKYEP